MTTTKAVLDCIDACNSCEQLCTGCANECEEMGGMDHCVHFCRECAVECSRHSRSLRVNDQTHAKSCIAACEACATECEKGAKHMDICHRCAEACRRCADTCRKAEDVGIVARCKGQRRHRASPVIRLSHDAMFERS